jgi:anti-sigma B factor antagonist
MGHKTQPPQSAANSSDNAVVDLPCDIDSRNACALRDRLVGLLNDGVPSLLMDMTATRFCDCAGIRVLVQVGQYAETLCTPVCVALPADGPARRVADLTGLSHDLQVATGTAAAERRLRSTLTPL